VTVQVEHAVELSAPPEDVWAFIADPEKRARSISVVDRYEVQDDDGRRATWYISLPIPVVGGTVAVETEDREREEPRFVRFVGRSKIMQVVGEHELEPTDVGTRLSNRFVVDGRVPGVETFFKRNLEPELRNLMTALGEELDAEVTAVEGLD
jgi:carbon monoxide dehydrogenase subunit G